MNGKRIHLTVTESTNSYTTELLSQNGIEPWTVVSCDYQSAGRGQRGKFWAVEPSQNLTMSVAFQPNLLLSDQFLVSAVAIQSVIDLLKAYRIEARFKWPNDILVDGLKVAGILIENQSYQEKVRWSIAGIGLNVNQTTFPAYQWPATSMKKIREGISFDVEELIQLLVQILKRNWNNAQDNQMMFLSSLNEHLHQKNEVVTFESEGHVFNAQLLGLAKDGSIRLLKDEKELTYYNGEIKIRRNAS